MFKDNNIPVKTDELIKLFFKNPNKKMEKHNILFLTEDNFYLDFYQLVNFTTKPENEEHFTDFMRKAKHKISSFRHVEKKPKAENIIYLPMTFNKILEYFSKKGKIRTNLNKINSTIVKQIF